MWAKTCACSSVKAIGGFLLLGAVLFWGTAGADAEGATASLGTGDLAGTWSVHGIVVGQWPAQRPGWYHTQITFDAKGNGIWSPIVDSLGNHDYVPESVTWTVDAAGALSMRVLPFHGAMNQKRDRIVAVVTLTPDPEGRDVVYGDSLLIMQKQSGVAFAPSDLAGTWSMHAVGVRESQADWEGWTFGDMTIDARGAFLDVPGSSLDSSGYPQGFGSGTIPLSPEGVLGVEGWGLMHGALSGSKDLAVYTHTDQEHPGK
jgi:hypothetical protein